MLRIRLRILQAEKETREKRTIPIRTLAEETGLSTRTIQDLRMDKAKGIQFHTVIALCKYFGVGVGELLEYVPEAGEEG